MNFGTGPETSVLGWEFICLYMLLYKNEFTHSEKCQVLPSVGANQVSLTFPRVLIASTTPQ